MTHDGPVDKFVLVKLRNLVDQVTEPARLTEAIRQGFPEVPEGLAQWLAVGLSQRLRASAKVLLE